MAQFGNEWRDYKGPVKEPKPTRAGVPGAVAGGSRTAAKRSKYGAVKTTVDGITFASKKEAERYQELKQLEKFGAIVGLELQPRFPLHVVTNGHGRDPKGFSVQVGTYVGDFRYVDGRSGEVVEDVKGMKTPIYRLKKKMVEAQYGITVVEV